MPQIVALAVGIVLTTGFNALKSLGGKRLQTIEQDIETNREDIAKLRTEFTEFRTDSRVAAAENKLRLDAIHSEIVQLRNSIFWEGDEA